MVEHRNAVNFFVGMFGQKHVLDEQHECEGKARKREGHRIVVAERDPCAIRVWQHMDEARRKKHSGGKGIAPPEEVLVGGASPSKERDGRSDRAGDQNRDEQGELNSKHAMPLFGELRVS